MVSSPEPLLDAANIDVIRGGRPLLHDVSLRVAHGEHWALLGPNGAGKSTLMTILGARGHPTAGTVDVLGRRLGRVDMRQLRTHIGHVDPRWRIDVPLTAHEVVLTGLTNTPELDRRHDYTVDEHRHADELLELLGMTTRRESLWPVMSQGERGRTLIARALMPRPALLLLDEPATGLDLAAREKLLTGIDQLRSEVPGLASVLVTHHLEDLPASTSHAMLLRDGQVIAAGAVDEALTSTTISTCFEHDVVVRRAAGRWAAVAA
ncbi:ATP-binding cassette domain-containing protein [Gordonia sp. Z-3]|uniref:ATP-binding cassette domain-containing protein n=2 Tax=Gordonia TaxID=2053 RepID=A0A9X3I563_9ACTN|nr:MULTISPECIES: ATP-binding cassette domain-containing protein [Gordonia]MAU83192.1 ABC transporter ATP-binding protein [Gordonia sp. (in: high G+C Gram-positive bacteria)]MAU83604.1 ABC transporter ATP-binding protein [Gordonia sp. (in: high G+C Gram-positive bacteria)]MCF3939166.1 ATP-binding cassette domain-containing protein [Gordonia tangerina]MCX2964931.1 ATP-binding cassette domain-containing protein [Gordonia aquimaris]MED5801375.1 ATP-binding cassette domain-containing protein [Gordo